MEASFFFALLCPLTGKVILHTDFLRRAEGRTPTRTLLRRRLANPVETSVMNREKAWDVGITRTRLNTALIESGSKSKLTVCNRYNWLKVRSHIRSAATRQWTWYGCAALCFASGRLHLIIPNSTKFT